MVVVEVYGSVAYHLVDLRQVVSSFLGVWILVKSKIRRAVRYADEARSTGHAID